MKISIIALLWYVSYSTIGSNAKACTTGSILSAGGNCYILMLVSPNGNAGIAGDTVNLQVKYSSLRSGRVSYYNTNLYLQYSGFNQYLSNMTTVVGGPNGAPFSESMPESSFVTQAINGSSGGNSAAQCGKYGSSNNTYQCIVQGSYLNIKLPVKSSVLPASFRYVLGNESALTAQGFKVTYSISNSTRPQTQVTYNNNGCLIPAFTNDGDWTCYITVQNPWDRNNTASGNIALNVVGYFDANPNLKIENNWINFFAVSPVSKVASIANTPNGDNIVGSDAYWMSGESWGLDFNESNPDSTPNGKNRFYTVNGDSTCIVDKITGLLWKLSSSNSYGITTPAGPIVTGTIPNITCGGVTYAGRGVSQPGYGQLIPRIPSSREIYSLFDVRYNATLPITFSVLNGVIGDPNKSAFLSSTMSLSIGGSATYAKQSFSGVGITSFAMNDTPVIEQLNDITSFGITPDWTYTPDNINNTISRNNNISARGPLNGFYVVYVASIPQGQTYSGYSRLLKGLPQNLFGNMPNLPRINKPPFFACGGSNGLNAAPRMYCANSEVLYESDVINPVGSDWPTSGNYPKFVDPAYPQVDANGYGVGRYVADATGDCLIDLGTGLMFQQKFSAADVGTLSTFGTTLANIMPSIQRIFDQGSGSRYGLCGMKNWRTINTREEEAVRNYYHMGYTNPFITFEKNGNLSNNSNITNWYSGGFGNQGSIFYKGNSNTTTNYMTTNSYTSYTNSTNITGYSQDWYDGSMTQFGMSTISAFSNGGYNTSAWYPIMVAGGAARIQP